MRTADSSSDLCANIVLDERGSRAPLAHVEDSWERSSEDEMENCKKKMRRDLKLVSTESESINSRSRVRISHRAMMTMLYTVYRIANGRKEALSSSRIWSMHLSVTAARWRNVKREKKSFAILLALRSSKLNTPCVMLGLLRIRFFEFCVTALTLKWLWYWKISSFFCLWCSDVPLESTCVGSPVQINSEAQVRLFLQLFTGCFGTLKLASPFSMKINVNERPTQILVHFEAHKKRVNLMMKNRNQYLLLWG